MATVRELFVSIGVIPNEDQFRRAEKRVADLRRGFFLLSAGVASVSALVVKSLGEAAKSADELDGLSQKTGVGVVALQELAFAAEQSGSSAEALNNAFTPLARNMGAAAGGSKEAASAFSELGVRIKNADGTLRPLEEVLVDSADGIAKLKDDASRSAAAMKIFGKSGNEIVPLLKNGAGAIDDLRKKARELGFVMGEDQVQVFADFKDTFDQVRGVALGFSRALARGLLPQVRALLVNFLRINQQSGMLIRQRIAEWGEKIGSVFRAIVNTVVSVGKVVGNLIGIFEDMPGPIQTVLALLGLLALAFFSPAVGIALLIALIAGLIDEFDAFLHGGESVFDDFFALVPDWLRDVGAFVLSFFSPFMDPESWNNVKTFWGDQLFELWETIKAGWQKIKDFIGGGIQSVVSLFGGGASPGANGTAGSPGVINSSNNATNNITVNATPGMSGEDVAQAVSSKLNTDSAEQLRAAYSAFGGQ